MSPRKRLEAPIPTDMPAELPPRSAPRPQRNATEAAAPPPRDERDEERPRFMSAEEKHQLIMTYAAQRKIQPVDKTQLFSLWAGVIVCTLAIGLGWMYAVRQSVANAIQSPAEQTLTELGVSGSQNKTNQPSPGEEFQGNINNAMQKLGEIQSRSMAELKTASAIRDEVQQAAASGTASAATTTVSKPSVKAAASKTSKKNAGYELPAGAKADKE